MGKIKVAINGFGRIGRLVFRQLLTKENVEVVAINDLTDNATLAHLLKYDSAHGKFKGTIEVDDQYITVNGHKIRALAERDPGALPWKELGVDTVVESTGIFRKKEQVAKHLEAGAKKVVISSPAKGSDVKTVVLGVNEDILAAADQIVSNASCTTNCLAPMAMLLQKNFGIKKGYATTVHAYTSDQSLQDAPHADLRRARAAGLNIVPTSTNSGTALGVVMPDLKGKVEASAMRVPVIDGSIAELTCILERETTVEEINKVFKDAAEGKLKGLVEYTTEELVSSDIIGNPHSCIFDAQLTQASGDFVKIVGWYDNEFGYSSRMADLVVHLETL